MRVSAGERGRKRKREREREKQNERTLLPKFLTCLQAPPAGQRYPAPCASSCAWWRWRGTAPRRRGRRSPGGGGGGALRRSRSRLLFFFFFFERERRAWGRERSMRRLVHHIRRLCISRTLLAFSRQNSPTERVNTTSASALAAWRRAIVTGGGGKRGRKRSGYEQKGRRMPMPLKERKRQNKNEEQRQPDAKEEEEEEEEKVTLISL